MRTFPSNFSTVAELMPIDPDMLHPVSLAEGRDPLAEELPGYDVALAEVAEDEPDEVPQQLTPRSRGEEDVSRRTPSHTPSSSEQTPSTITIAEGAKEEVSEPPKEEVVALPEDIQAEKRSSALKRCSTSDDELQDLVPMSDDDAKAQVRQYVQFLSDSKGLVFGKQINSLEELFTELFGLDLEDQNVKTKYTPRIIYEMVANARKFGLLPKKPQIEDTRTKV